MALTPGQLTIPGRVLAAHLRVSYNTLRFEWKTRLPPVDHDARHPRYDHTTVNAFLNADVRGFATAPTVEDLLSGKLKLLTPEEVVQRIPRLSRRNVVETWAHRGKMAALKLGSQTRFEESSVLRVAERPDAFTTKQVSHILGVKPETVRVKLIKPGKLQSLPDPDANNYHLVPRQSLVAFMGEPNGLLLGTDSEDWIDDRLATGDPLLSTPEAMRFVAEDIHCFKRLVVNGSLRFIWSPSKKERYFCPESLLVYVERFPLNYGEIGHVYGTTKSAVWLWRQEGLMDCTLHRHQGSDGGQLYRACVIGMLRHQLSPGINPGHWFATRMGTELKLIQLAAAAGMLGMERRQLVAAAKRGDISGVCTPTGLNWAFSPRRIERFKRSQRRAAQQQ